MRRAIPGWLLTMAVAAQAATLEPLDARNGFADLDFGVASESIPGLMPWTKEADLDIQWAEADPQVGGVQFEARLLRFWENRLLQIQYVTTNFTASRNYFKLMASVYGRPSSKTGANSYEWIGKTVNASYSEDGKTATVTYSSVALLKERQRKSKRRG